MPPASPSSITVDLINACAGKRAVAWQRASGGYTAMERWVVQFGDGTSAFAKIATGDAHAGWLRTEWHVYQHLHGRFMPEVLAWQDGELPILLLEDLHAAHWPPPWSRDQIDLLLQTLDTLHRSPHPPGLPSLASMSAEIRGWYEVDAAPQEFLSLGLCSKKWLVGALPDLIAAEDACRLDGESVLHLDVRSDNICFDGERCVLVDWNWACIGNGEIDVAALLPSLHSEGGPLPEEILPNAPEMAAILSGYFAKAAGRPPWPGGEPVRALQLRQLKSALGWAVRALGLPSP